MNFNLDTVLHGIQTLQVKGGGVAGRAMWIVCVALTAAPLICWLGRDDLVVAFGLAVVLAIFCIAAFALLRPLIKIAERSPANVIMEGVEYNQFVQQVGVKGNADLAHPQPPASIDGGIPLPLPAGAPDNDPPTQGSLRGETNG